MIHLTEQAATQVQQAAASGGMAGLALRIAVRRTKEGDLDYGMGFDEPKEEDLQSEHYGVTVVISKAFGEVLNNLTVDYVELNPGEFHFIFQNPNDPQHQMDTKTKSG